VQVYDYIALSTGFISSLCFYTVMLLLTIEVSCIIAIIAMTNTIQLALSNLCCDRIESPFSSICLRLVRHLDRFWEDGCLAALN
jgi:hypothetical protein